MGHIIESSVVGFFLKRVHIYKVGNCFYAKSVENITFLKDNENTKHLLLLKSHH